jgi:hypothetical protein
MGSRRDVLRSNSTTELSETLNAAEQSTSVYPATGRNAANYPEQRIEDRSFGRAGRRYRLAPRGRRIMTGGPDPEPAALSADDDRSSAARLRRAELRVAHLEGHLEALQAQVAALEAADEHRRSELAEAHAEAADARAAAREAQGRAEERRHLIDELREQLEEARTARSGSKSDDGGKVLGWRARRRTT